MSPHPWYKITKTEDVPSHVTKHVFCPTYMETDLLIDDCPTEKQTSQFLVTHRQQVFLNLTYGLLPSYISFVLLPHLLILLPHVRVW